MTVRFSCVVDGSPRFVREARVWATTLIALGGRPPTELVVHVIDGTTAPDLVAQCARLGIEVVEVPTVDRRHRHSNKLAQLESPALDVDVVVLTDCDIAFAGPLDALFEGEAEVAAKVVDSGIPSLSDWRVIFRAAGFDDEPLRAAGTHTGAPTYAGNFNGGVLAIRRAAFEQLREAWPRWNRWLLDGPRLIDDYEPAVEAPPFGRWPHWAFYADQISFGLAVRELGLTYRHLPVSLNFHPGREDAPDVDPLVLHYHAKGLARDGTLVPAARPTAAVDARIAAVNAVLRRADTGDPAGGGARAVP